MRLEVHPGADSGPFDQQPTPNGVPPERSRWAQYAHEVIVAAKYAIPAGVGSAVAWGFIHPEVVYAFFQSIKP